MRSLNSVVSVVEKHQRVLNREELCCLCFQKNTLSAVLRVDCRGREEARHLVRGGYMTKTEICTDGP